MAQTRLNRVTLIDTVVEHLERSILTGEFPAQSRLPREDVLSSQFDVSRPVIREGLARLRERGYVETLNGRGTFVREPNIDAVSQSMLRHLQMHMGGDYTVDDLYEVRRVIELEAAGLAAARAKPSDLDRLEADLEIMRKTAVGDPSAYTAADVSFHLQLARATRNPLFPLLVSPLVDVIVQGMFHSVRAAHEGMETGVAEHARIIEQLRRGDVDGAKREMEQHLLASRRIYPEKIVGRVHVAQNGGTD